jgi:hypothetical protein
MDVGPHGILADAVRNLRSAGAALEDIAATLRFAADELRSDSVR